MQFPAESREWFLGSLLPTYPYVYMATGCLLVPAQFMLHNSNANARGTAPPVGRRGFIGNSGLSNRSRTEPLDRRLPAVYSALACSTICSQ